MHKYVDHLFIYLIKIYRALFKPLIIGIKTDKVSIELFPNNKNFIYIYINGIIIIFDRKYHIY